MTIEELIEKLRGFDPELKVLVPEMYGASWVEVDTIGLRTDRWSNETFVVI